MSTSEEQTTAEETTPEGDVEETEVEETEKTVDEKPEEVANPEDHAAAVPTGKNIQTLTEAGNGGMPEGWFDNFGTPDLRSYLKFWEDEKKSAGKAEHLLAQDPEKWAWLPNRAAHIAALREEISLREAKRSQGGPGAGPRVEEPADETPEEPTEVEEMTDEELEEATAPAESA